jgi:hypothetical protein
MNERIKVLIQQATTRIDPTAHDGACWDFDQEKFALLIIQECIDIIAPYTIRMSRPGEEYLHPIQEIKKNFGVTND